MNPLPIALVLSSAILHALYNLMARRGRSEAAFFHRMLVWVAVIGIIPAVVAEWQIGPFPGRVYLAAAASGGACGLYYLFLTAAYESSDFTVVYPVARSLPVLLVGLADTALGRYPTAAGWGGMLLVVVGCLFTPLTSLRDIGPRHHLNLTTLWMLFAAVGTAIYSMVDKAASDAVQAGPVSAARYCYLFFVTSLCAYSVLLRTFRRRAWAVACNGLPFAGSWPGFDDLPPHGPAHQSPARMGWAMPLSAAVANFFAYWLVLWAYQLSQNASYVVAFRQFGIVVGVVLAFWWYRERGVAVRLAASAVITAGLLLIALWGR